MSDNHVDCTAATCRAVQVRELEAERDAARSRIHELEAGLQTIENLVNAPHWNTTRRYRVGEIARAALTGENR